MQNDLTEKEKRDNVDKKNNQNIDSALIVKLILVLFCLLTVAFVSGVVIGKNGRRSVDRTSSDEEGINEKLSNCIFNSDELRGKYLKLRDAAREKGLVDENDAVNAKVVCSVKPGKTFHETSLPKQPKPEEQKNNEPESVETSPDTSQKEPSEPEKTKSGKTKSAETFQETSLQEKPKPDKNKTIDEILNEKGVSPKKETAGKENPKKETVKKCLFSIQIFAANTKEQADAAVKKLKSLKPRVVSGDNNGKQWYKLRTGCFDSREAAEAGLPKVKELEKSAYIVSE